MIRQWLIDLRTDKGLTHEQVADLCNIKRPYYTMIENGRRRPGVEVAKKIGAILDFDWTLFFNPNSNDSLHLSASIKIEVS